MNVLWEVDRELQRRWMLRPVEERFLIVGGMYEAEKAIIESLAPMDYSKQDLREFVYYHMHGEKWPFPTKDD